MYKYIKEYKREDARILRLLLLDFFATFKKNLKKTHRNEHTFIVSIVTSDFCKKNIQFQ